MKPVLAIVVLALLLCGLPAAGQGPAAYPCYRLAAAPVIDGKLDDAVWNALPEATGFRTLKQVGFAVRKPTAFRVGWTPEGLYLAIRCKEPFTRSLTPLTGDGEPLWDDDSVEVFLTPAGPDYLQLIVNAAAARWNGRPGGALPLGAWTARARITAEDWTVELLVPFAVVGKTPREGDSWRFNLGRNVLGGPPAERYSSWAAVERGFGDVPKFAGLEFRGAPVAAEVTSTEGRLAAEYQAYLTAQAAGNLIANGSFEDGLKSWGLREPKRIAADPTTSTVGQASLKLDGSGGADWFVNAMQGLKLKPATKYVLRCDLKRSKFSSGTISVDVIERDRKDAEWTYHRCGDRPGKGDVPDAWGHYELRFQTSANLLEAMVMLYNIKSGATAWYDGVELVEDDGSSATGAPVATTAVQVELTTREAVARLLVDGEAVTAPAGQPVSIRIREGLSVFGIDATAQGPNPGVKIRLARDPRTDTRWRATGQEDPAWMSREFDDQRWPVPAPDAQGFLWHAGATRAFLRQVVLWNQGHDGPDRCINPLIREWGISEGSMETLFLALYSHFPYPLDGYEFELDVPDSFRLLDILHEEGRNLLNLKPSAVTTEPVEHEGRKYTRYRIAEPPNQVRRDRIGGLLLPLFLDRWPDRERTTAWYYRRLGKGNFTELLQQIPVRVLPPIDGRLPRKIMLSQYCSVPWDYCRLSPEHLDQHLRQSFRAGFNTWIISRLGVDQDPYLKTVHDRVLDAGGRIILWNNYPYYGLKNTAKMLGYRWLETHPEARARYFADSESWEKRDQYCPTYVLGPGRAAFGAEVKAAYAAMLKALPGASIVWSDWEEAPWVSAGAPYQAARDGLGSWCFCDRCKAEFRAWAKLPAEADLSDAAIFAQHKSQWDSFRSELDGRLAAIAKQAANELGKPYMLYSWTAHTKLWAALNGSLDLAFPGCPGNGAADGYQQRHLDETMLRFRDQVGLSRDKVMGQRFSFFYYYQIAQPQEFWRKWQVMSPTGYIEPKSWKTQILRVVAALGMGVDLQSSLECSGGMLYWIGEATRILATYEDLFHEGQRDDSLATCDSLEYPQVLVLKRGAERLVLLFNESDKPKSVTLHNRDVRPGQTATVYGTDQTTAAAELKLTIPPEDVAVVHIR